MYTLAVYTTQLIVLVLLVSRFGRIGQFGDQLEHRTTDSIRARKSSVCSHSTRTGDVWNLRGGASSRRTVEKDGWDNW